MPTGATKPEVKEHPSFEPHTQQRRRLYPRSSSFIYPSPTRTSSNSKNGYQNWNLTSHLETPLWGAYTAPLDELDRDTYVDHLETALTAARAAVSSFKAAENYLEHLVLEQELGVKRLKDEIEDIRSRSQVARQQVASLRATLILEGANPSLPNPIYSANYATIPGFLVLDSGDEDDI